MTREDRLDALLDTLHSASPAQHRALPTTPHANGANGANGDAGLLELVAVAHELLPLADAQPDPAFAANLGTQLLARAAERRADIQALTEVAPVAEAEEAAVASLADAPTLELPVVAGRRAATATARVRRFSPRLALVAAALLVLLGGAGWGVALAISNSHPGDPLYGLQQLTHTVRENTAPDSATRAQLHLTYAQKLLADLRTAATQPSTTTSYAGTLSALNQEISAASAQIAQVPAGSQQTALQQSLAALRGDERTTLQSVLPALSWDDRLTTTQALGALGVAVPHVAMATVVPADHGQWTVTLSGSGFAAGAILLVNGHPAGTVTALTDTSLTAQVAPGLVRDGTASLGVGNPDGTAATATAIQTLAEPTPAATPIGGHGGGSGSGGHGGGNGNDGSGS